MPFTLALILALVTSQLFQSRRPPTSLTPAVDTALAALRNDTAALAHLELHRHEATLREERHWTLPHWQELLQMWDGSIAASQQCSWRGLPRDSIVWRALTTAKVDTSSSTRKPTVVPASQGGRLIAFVSPSFQGMQEIAFFLADPERDSRGGDLHAYASLNRSVEYLVCDDGSGHLELLGPSLFQYE
jgi:hypothetical protein